MIHKRIEEDLLECRLFLLKADGMWSGGETIALSLYAFDSSQLLYYDTP